MFQRQKRLHFSRARSATRLQAGKVMCLQVVCAPFSKLCSSTVRLGMLHLRSIQWRFLCGVASSLLFKSDHHLSWKYFQILTEFQLSLNFAKYFEKLSERFALLGTYCPRYSLYEKLFSKSTRLRDSLANFYAIIVKFCTKALTVFQENGMA